MNGDSNKPKSGAKTGVLAALGALALNFKAFGALALKGGWLVKFSWLLKSGATMIFALWVYTVTYGWGFAFMLIALLLLHELGHWVWAKANNIDASAPMFIPFLGAAVFMKNLPPDEATNAWIAFAGPLIGGLAAVTFWYLGVLTGNGLLMAGGSFGFFLNLFQLVPARPLDGGFILGAVSRWALIPGTIIIVILALMTHSVLLILISVISIFSLLRKKAPVAQTAAPAPTVGEYEQAAGNGGSGQPQPEPATAPTYDTMKPATPKQRWAIGLAYLSLAGFLGFMHMHSLAVMYDKLGTKSPVRYMMNKETDSDKATQTRKSPDKSDSDSQQKSDDDK